MFARQALMAEGVHVFAIITLKLHEPVPHELVAVQVTVVVPIGKLLPDGGVQVAVTDGEPPDGFVYVSTIPAALLVPSLILEGQTITGVSLIVTLNEQDEEPQELAAVHVTAVVPVENEDPDAGEQTTFATGVPVAEGVL